MKSQRLQTIKKKCHELSTLCNVDVCMVSISTDKTEVETWPENHNQLKPILKRFKQHQTKFSNKGLGARVVGTTNQLRRGNPSSWTKDSILSLLDSLSSNSLKIFSDQIAEKIQIMSSKIESFKDQSLRQSMFFSERMDNFSNSNIYNLDNVGTPLSPSICYKPVATPDPNDVLLTNYDPTACDFFSDIDFENIFPLNDLPSSSMSSETINVTNSEEDPSAFSLGNAFDDLPTLPNVGDGEFSFDDINCDQIDQYLNFHDEVPSNTMVPNGELASNTMVPNGESDWFLSSPCSNGMQAQSQRISTLMDEFLRECF